MHIGMGGNTAIHMPDFIGIWKYKLYVSKENHQTMK